LTIVVCFYYEPTEVNNANANAMMMCEQDRACDFGHKEEKPHANPTNVCPSTNSLVISTHCLFVDELATPRFCVSEKIINSPKIRTIPLGRYNE
jgi:hypothetical protein